MRNNQKAMAACLTLIRSMVRSNRMTLTKMGKRFNMGMCKMGRRNWRNNSNTLRCKDKVPIIFRKQMVRIMPCRVAPVKISFKTCMDKLFKQISCPKSQARWIFQLLRL